MKNLSETLVGKLIFAAVLAIVLSFVPQLALAGGASTCEIGISSGTNFVKCATDESSSVDLTLYRVIFETATIGDYVVCFDSAPATYLTGLVAGNDGTSSVPRIAFTSHTATGFSSNQDAPVPTDATNGITCAKSNAGARAVVKYKRTAN